MITSKKIIEAASMSDDELVSKCEAKLKKAPDGELKKKREGIVAYYKSKNKLTDKQRDSLIVFYAAN